MDLKEASNASMRRFQNKRSPPVCISSKQGKVVSGRIRLVFIWGRFERVFCQTVGWTNAVFLYKQQNFNGKALERTKCTQYLFNYFYIKQILSAFRSFNVADNHLAKCGFVPFYSA